MPWCILLRYFGRGIPAQKMHLFFCANVDGKSLTWCPMTSEWCIYLNSQIEVLLNKFFIALSPIANAVVDFEHTRVPSKWQWCVARMQLGPESSPVHSLSKVNLFCDNAYWLVLSKILPGQEILLKHQPGTLDILFFCIYLCWDSCW